MIAEHASDCALNGAPAQAPQPCSCGVSDRFLLWGYDICNDTFRWEERCRETLIADVVGRALARCYRLQSGALVRQSTLISRAIRCGLTDNERAEIRSVWVNTLTPDVSMLQRYGIDDIFAWPGGAFVSEERRREIERAPNDDEITAAMSGWIEWWATFPEPERAGL